MKHERKNRPATGNFELFNVLSRPNRKRLCIVLAFGLISGVFELVGLASIMPFIASATGSSGDGVSNKWIQAISDFFGVGNNTVLLHGILSVIALLAACTAGAVNQYVQLGFLHSVRIDISSRLFSNHATHVSTQATKTDAPSLVAVLFRDVDHFINGYLAPLIGAVTRASVVLLLLGFLIAQDVVVALSTLGFLGSAYVLIYMGVRKKQKEHGEAMALAAENHYRTALEGIGAAKELLVLGRTQKSIRSFDNAVSVYSEALMNNSLTVSLPRYLVEAVAFGGIILVAISLTYRQAQGNTIPLLAMYAFAGYRLLPSVQQLYNAAVSLRYYGPTLLRLRTTLCQRSTSVEHSAAKERLSQAPHIKIEGVTLRSEENLKLLLHNVTLEIAPNEILGIVGRTGAGKSTLLDAIMGLYHSEMGGRLSFDGTQLDEKTVRRWMNSIGYVPQHVYLSRASITENIAFGVPACEIDLARVCEVARMADVEEFAIQLPGNLSTIIGDGGIALSGGQRQRIGIARALYGCPTVLLLDEPTSALDGESEEFLLRTLELLRRDCTIIVVAHRPETIARCTRVVLMEGGSVIEDGQDPSHSHAARANVASVQKIIAHAYGD
jgi:ABC-type bacteriocin/lantibiotic exporter with double-glycine peptidase domain